ncbi:Mitochondrial zinc maintenance protein 1, mitochondrial [Fusarium musae]|uniref:Mitochondrial zinc maintenance protein 1, mitochondrial n=1 Tax=Fusarium musae TaxID=1042133 RepID=A0A9P8DEQ5_9HYPO|nr:Mitochondrial zinc maintenance protein 1, mitochondrial [Fusarium musae]KAG9500443.1 Mitochondrial zinc maintenance protein 1, mitochondrial [Fusarium musae]
MATAPAPALNAYRHLMRAARIAFQGDAPILSAAQLQIRNEFRQKASADAADASAAIKHAEEVAKVLRQNVVQGQRTEEGKDTFSEFRMIGRRRRRKLIAFTELRIHEDIERGDNESIKTAGKGTVGGGCCGGGGKK